VERPAPPAPRPQAPLVLPWEASEHREKLSQHGVTVVVPVVQRGEGRRGRRWIGCRSSTLGVPLFVLAVDDGSTDGTARGARETSRRALSPSCACVRAPREPAATEPRSRPASRTRGTEVVMITDADGTYPEEQASPTCSTGIDDGAEMAVGARTRRRRATFRSCGKPAKCVPEACSRAYLAGDRRSPTSTPACARSAASSCCKLPADPAARASAFTTTITLASAHERPPRRVRRPSATRKREGRSKIKPDPRHARLHRADHPHGDVLQPAEGLLPGRRSRCS
jgi:hypothetical protein